MAATAEVITRIQKMNLEMVKVAYHRNGVGGEGFHVVLFRDLERPTKLWPALMVATVFEEQGQVAVLDVEETAAYNIEFAQGNSWRGDTYEPTLRAMIQAWEEDRAAPEYIAPPQ